MPNSANDDWRLNGQKAFLQGAELERAEYSPPRPEWDHDHCEFCWAKFMDTDSPDVLRVGYKTVGDSRWICDACFAHFKAQFKWTLKP